MTAIDLRAVGERHEQPLLEISGQGNTTATTCTFERTATGVRLTIRCDDSDMASLVATAPDRRPDGFLYEEDCFQLTLAHPGDSQYRGFLLLNPYNKSTRQGIGADWHTHLTRDGHGWTATVEVPVDADLPGVGVSLHRYFRGLHHEVHSLTPTIPHPLKPAEFVVLATHRSSQVPAVKEDYLLTTTRAAEAALEYRLAQCRQRLAVAREADGPRASMQTLTRVARERLAMPVLTHVSGLSWNEAHLLHALVDLFHLDRDPAWIEQGLDRIDQIWNLRSDRLGQVDEMWGFLRPTWYEQGTGICLTTGTILYPITVIMNLIDDQTTLHHLRPRMANWTAWCLESIATHDDEWLDLPDGTGVYIEPYCKGPRRIYPKGGSRFCPVNRMYFLAIPMLHLARRTGDAELLRRVTGMARYFEKHSERTPEGGMVWEYLVSRYPAEGEDTSHALCQVEFVRACAEAGVVFDESHMRAIGTTLAKVVLAHGDVAHVSLRGYDPGLSLATCAWAPLCRYEPQVFPALEAIANVALSEGRFSFEKQGWGVRVLAALETGRRFAGAGAAN